MILYHGTNTDFQDIDLSRSFPYKDFGKGFCLTGIRDRAILVARHKVCAFGGSVNVQEYLFDESNLRKDSLKVQFFNGISIDWAEFILRNREQRSLQDYDYDIVAGPAVDDGVAFLINRYESGAVTMREFIRILKNRNLDDQYYFKTPEAISFLRRVK